MENYKGNSHKMKAEKALEEKKIEKVVTGNVKTKKKSEIRKWAEVFLPNDVTSVKDYIFGDIFVPLVKEFIVDTVGMCLYGETNHNRPNRNTSKVLYGRFYDDNKKTSSRPSSGRKGYDYDEIILDNRREADSVLSKMDDILDEYEMVSVADLYDLVGITSRRFTDNNFGWTNLRGAEAVRTRNGEYILKLPKVLPLN